MDVQLGSKLVARASLALPQKVDKDIRLQQKAGMVRFEIGNRSTDHAQVGLLHTTAYMSGDIVENDKSMSPHKDDKGMR